MVQLCASISRSASIRGGQNQQAQGERTQSQKGRFCILLCIESFKMPHDAGLRRPRIGWVDYDEIRPEVRLKLGCGFGVSHHDHAFAQSYARAEFLTACFSEAGTNHAQDYLRLIQLVAGIRVCECRNALAGPRWGT
jgi:hypothetical protein